ncbi:hypothetical protein [Saccharicrinis aurantiacus]|uniref:hypothetical protein n=1 Tax=Saccharicrinis aurantiacus TaxID=1849719 RepID=UPI002492CE71|nr:hypothetical protein [Saccharicrinis aurantiacus]
MKFNYIYLIVIAIITFACEPLEDITNQLDDAYTGPLNKSLTYTLTPSDYVSISKLVQEDALTPEELELAKSIAEDTILYKGYSVDYIPSVIDAPFAGYANKSITEVTFRTADALEAAVDTVAEYYEMQAARFWKFSPVVDVVMGTPEFQLITDYVKNSKDLGTYWEDRYNGGRDLYYGSTAQYSNFDLSHYNRANSGRDFIGDATVDPTLAALFDTNQLAELDEALIDRVGEGVMIMLKEKYKEAGAQIESNGVTITYRVTNAKLRYNDKSEKLATYSFNCTKASPNPEFVLLSGPVF